MPTLPQLQQFQVPNYAADLLTKQTTAQLAQTARQKVQNEAALEMQKLGLRNREIGISEGRLGLDIQKQQVEVAKLQREQAIDANEFALNLLTGVNSEEDLSIAKHQFASRYPEHLQMVNQVLPSYNPTSVRLIRNSLRDETTRLKQEELAFSQAMDVGRFGLEERAQRLGERKQTFEETRPRGYAPGTLIKTPGGTDQQVPTAPPKPDFELFTDSEGNQAYLAKGASVPSGWTRVDKRTGPAVNVYTGDLARTTRTKVESEIIEGVKNVQSFRKTGEMFKDEYLEVMGKGKKKAAEIMDKAGVSTEDQRKYINEYAQWFRQAKSDFLAYRKWVTGVAGGEKEMQEIATAFPDPVNNSPEQYKANLKSIEETTKRVLQLNADFLRLGIDMDQPLSVVLEQAKEKGFDQLPPGAEPQVIRYTRDTNGNLVREEEVR
jgi:hypothetical protein